MSKRRTLGPKRSRVAIEREVDAVQDSLDRLQVMYEEGGDIDAAMADLQINVNDLEDAIEKAQSEPPQEQET